MNDEARRGVSRSPNYPQQSLELAVKNGLALLEKEKLHAVPVDIVAKNLGYKDANNGKARSVLANLKAFGILKKAPGGKLAVSQDIQRYKLSPSDADKVSYLKQWIRKPLLYSKLLEKYPTGLPSDAVLIFELVDEHGFNEEAAQKAISVFRESMKFVDIIAANLAGQNEESEEELEEEQAKGDSGGQEEGFKIDAVSERNSSTSKPSSSLPPISGTVRYPIRLAGGRMAYIDVPDPFFEKDKDKLKAQLQIIGTVDEDNEFEDLDM